MSKQEQRSLAWFWLAIAAAVTALTLLSYSNTFRHLLDSVTGWAKDLIGSNPILGAVVFFLFSMISAMLAFISSAVLVPAANLVWGRLVTFALLWGGWIAGGIVAFFVGRLARPLLIRVGYKHTLERYQHYVSRRSKFWMVLVLCFAVPSEIPGYVLGGAHYPFWKFVVAIGLSEAVYALALVFAGDTLLGAKRLQLVLIAGAVLLIGGGASILFLKLRKRR